VSSEAPPEDDRHDTAPPPEIILQDKQAVARLLETVANLPPREAFILHKFDGLSYPGWPEQLGISSAWWKHLMPRAIAAQVDRTPDA
jgi:DNA-directed RNA polymerase specialized sigma24 family protein